MAGIIEVKDQGKLRIYDADNSHYIDIVVPSSVTANRTITIPDASFTVPQADTNTVYTHPNHSGEVTSTADGATVIADNIVDEANLKVSNSAVNGYMLTAQSGNTGGLTWAAAPTGFDPDGAVVFNESSADADFRIESNASTHFFNLDSNLNTLSFGGDTATDNDTGKFKINADGQVRFGGFAGNPSGGGGSGYTQTNDRTGSLMIDTSGGITHQNTNSNAYFNYRGSTQHNNYWNFRYGGSQVGSIQWSSGSTAFNTSSDYRLKENVNYSWDATTRLKQLKPARFNWIADETNTLIDGFIAHEAATVVPESVSGTKDALEQHDEFSEEVKAGTKNVGDNKLNDDGNTIIKPQAIDHSKLVPLLVKTIQELEARITTLENA